MIPLNTVLQRANEHFQILYVMGETEYLLQANPKDIKEYEYCYSIGWTYFDQKSQSVQSMNDRFGVAPLLVSKISDDVEFGEPTKEGIATFELNIRGLERYWSLTISYDKKKLSILKTLLALNTPDLLKRVNEKGLIIIENNEYTLRQLQQTCKEAQIKCRIAHKIKSKTTLD